MRINASGTYGWTKKMGGTGVDTGYSVAVNSAGNIFMTGTFNGTVNFAADFSGTDSKTSAGDLDVFVARINIDEDGDGLTNSLENPSSCPNRTNPDSDGDGLCDGNLTVAGVCVAGEDINGNGVVDQGETDPCNADSDGDGTDDDLDCDPLDPNVWLSCATCVDLDNDTWYAGCDQYLTINGPDCSDADPQNWTMCGTCADLDSDAHRGTNCNISNDCNDSNPNAWDTCLTCVDTDTDNWFAWCNTYVGINGPDCSDSDPQNWTMCASCSDADGDTYRGTNCNVSADCNDSNFNTWNTCATCIDADVDGWYQLCNTYLPFPANAAIGTETSTWDYPLGTYSHDSRTQIIYLASEIGGPGLITTLSLDVASVPGQVLNSFAIRMKHVTMAEYSSYVWENSDWTLVYMGNEPPGSTGWRTFTFGTPFAFNGLDNVMVDISFNNASSSSSGTVSSSNSGTMRSLFYRTNSLYGDPLTWSGSTPPPSSGKTIPNIRLGIIRSNNGPDCNDSDRAVNPGQTEIVCNGIDDDCNPSTLDAWDDDNDGLTHCEELVYGTSDLLADTDGDRISDFIEAHLGSDPLNPNIFSNQLAGVKSGIETRVTKDPSSSAYPSLAWTGSEYGMFWQDGRDGNTEIYFTRVSDTGQKVGGDIRLTNAGNSSINPAVSWTGSEFGVAWEDYRDGNGEIYFLRVSATGTQIGSDTRLTTHPSSSVNPAIAWAETQYVIVWEDSRDANQEIYLARVSAAGSKLAEIRLTSDSNVSRTPSVVWTGTEFGVVWEEWRDKSSDGEIYFLRANAVGSKIGPDLRITASVGTSQYPSILWANGVFGVSWNDGRDGNDEIYFLRVSSAGVKIGSDIRITAAANLSSASSLIWTGSEYGVSWHDMRDGNNEIYLTRMGSDGLKLGSELRVTTAAGSSSFSSLLWSGSEFGISWCDDRDGNQEIYFAPVGWNDGDGDGLTLAQEAAAGTNATDWDSDNDFTKDGLELVLGSNALDVSIVPNQFGIEIDDDVRLTFNSSLSLRAYLAWTGSEFGAIWTDSRDGNYEIYFGRMSPTGEKIGSDLRLTANSSNSDFPSLCWTGSEFGVSWQDFRDGNGEIYFSRVSASGAKVGSDVRITNNSGNSGNPAIAWTGSEFGLVWDDNRDGNLEIYLARVSSNGVKLSSDIRQTIDANASYSAVILWTGSEFGISWTDSRNPAQEIYFSRASGSGGKVGGDVRVSYDAGVSGDPSLTWSGSEYGVSWADFRDGNGEIYFSRLSAGGIKIGGDQRITTGANDSISPALSWNGSEYGVAWSDNFFGDYEIYFSSLSVSGSPPGPFVRLTSSAGSSNFPSLAWTGSEFGVGWYDFRDGNNEIYFSRIGWNDGDGDGLVRALELVAGANPSDWDTDNDTVRDGWDCAPLNPNVWASCATCLDSDNDGWFVGCDQYLTINGPDCKDTDPQNWTMCASCSDPDSDGHRGTDCNVSGDCDESNPNTWDTCATCVDGDSDTWYQECNQYLTVNGPDCDDGEPTTNPGAPEICDGIDNNCANGPDDGLVFTEYFADIDLDTFGGASLGSFCSQPAGSVLTSTDCDDADAHAWDTCATCVDNDADGWFLMCNDYTGINGPDCCDSNPNTWNTCAACAGPESYGWGRRFGGSGDDGANGLEADPAGKLYSIGAFSGTVDFAADFGGGDPKTSSGGKDLFITRVNADGSYGWTRRIGGTGDDASNGVAIDQSGNVYVVGYFNGSVDFAADWLGSDPKSTTGGTDIFITRVNADGSYGWTKVVGGVNDDYGYGVSVDSAGNVFVAGYFGYPSGGTINFAGDWSGTDSKTSAGGADVFLTRVNADGSYGWTRRAGGTGQDVGFSVSADAGGNAYVTGYFNGTVNFADDWAGTDPKSSSGTQDIFVTRVNADGSYGWTRRMGGAGTDYGKDVWVDKDGVVYLTGYFNGSVNFAADWSGSDLKTSAGVQDVFITRVNTGGNYGWTRRMGGTGTDYGQAIFADDDGNVFLTGAFTGTVDFASDFGSTDSKTSAGLGDVFITRITANGAYRWSKAIGGTASDGGWCISGDANENVYLGGWFSGTVDLAQDFETSNINASAGGADGFMVKILVPPDEDNDCMPDTSDNCLADWNPLQENADGDSLGDACDPDDDNDGASDLTDCAPLDSAHWDDCGTCVDTDGDDYGAGCDLGTDCDDDAATGDTCHDSCSTFYADNDSDTYGDLLTTIERCSPPAGYVSDNTDCDDAVASCNTDCADADSDLVRACDGDCNDNDDLCSAGCADLYLDSDSDGYGTGALLTGVCPSSTRSLVDGDCDDAVASCNTDCADADSDLVRACDGDCNDNDSLCSAGCADLYLDADSDGYGTGALLTGVCPSSTRSLVDGDCDDAVASCNTDCADADSDLVRACDGDCNDNDGLCSAGCADLYTDSDLDGYGDNSAPLLNACPAAGRVADSTDCDAAVASCNTDCADADSDLVRACDGDCNDNDDLCSAGCADLYTDGDGDGYGTGALLTGVCPSSTRSLVDGDCDDILASVNPGETEICNGIDDNCIDGIDEGCGPTDTDGDGLVDTLESNTVGTDPFNPDTDADGVQDGVEWNNSPCYDPLNEDSDGDGRCDGNLTVGGVCVAGEDMDGNGVQDAGETGVCDPDSDDDGLDDGIEVGCLNALYWDSDGDYLPDGFEQANLAEPLGALDPCLAADGALDFDGDSNLNAHEYWNGSDPWHLDPVPNPAYNPACYYWGKSDNNYYVQPSDIVASQYSYVGTAVDFSMTLPHCYDVLDINANGNPDPPDIAALQFMFVEANLPGGYPSSPSALSLEDAPSAAVAVGDTTHVTVSLHAQGPAPVLFSSGFSVVFWVESGNATLLGGEASGLGEPAGNRYDVSMEASLGALSNIVVRVDGPGPIVIRAKVPTCGVPTLGRWAGEIQLGAPVVINP